jgi:aryl-alcohol dehydrogenase-like predicted oxidoreductase
MSGLEARAYMHFAQPEEPPMPIRIVNPKPLPLTRRDFVASAGALGALTFSGVSASAQTANENTLRRAIPRTGEQIPAIGMGTWITFNVGGDTALRAKRLEVMQRFFARGGTLIDSSPMYGSSEEVVGWCLDKMQAAPPLFAATKVWTMFQRWGVSQMQTSEKLWGGRRFDLMQIHNMLDWENHLETLKTWKSEGRVRYIGITTSHGRRHGDLAKALARSPFDFVQFTYNIADREVEERLLPLAAERKTAVIINRPFQGGSLFDAVKGKPLPAWASEFGAQNWAQFFLKFVVSHPAVTCAIPATSQVAHMEENMGALAGRLPDAAIRERMIRHFAELS